MSFNNSKKTLAALAPHPFFTKVLNSLWLQVLCAVTFLMLIELISILSYRFVDYAGVPLPGSFVILLYHGYFMAVILAAFFVIAMPLSALFWYLGGEKRVLANYIITVSIGIIMANISALYIFNLWDGLNLTLLPFSIFRLLNELPKGSIGYNHLVISLSVSYALFFLALMLPFFTRQTKAEKVFGKAHFASGFEIKKAGLFAKTGIVLGKTLGRVLRLPGFESVLIVAPTGSGKTTSIAVPNLIEWQGSVVVNDLKGELYRLSAKHRKEILKNNCIKWAPADPSMNTAKYNPFFYVKSDPKIRIRDLQLIAETLIADEHDIHGKFWCSSSREILVMLALYLLETNGVATLGQINALSRKKNFFMWLELAIKEEQVKEPLFYQYANSLLIADKEKSRPNILKDFHSRMTLFVDPIVANATSGNGFDFRKLRHDKMSIYISIGETDMRRLSPILTLFWAQLINAMADHELDLKVEPYPVLAVLDEFGNMGRLKKLQQGVSFMRSYRVRCLLIVQYLAQIVSVYGKEDAKAFINSKIRLIHALNDTDDAKLFATALGFKTVRVNSHSVNSGYGDNSGGRSSSLNFQSRFLMTPDEILQLSKNNEIILVESQPPIKAKKAYWFKERRYKNVLNAVTATGDDDGSN